MRIAVCYAKRDELEKCCRIISESISEEYQDVVIDRYCSTDNFLFRLEDVDRNYDIVFLDGNPDDPSWTDIAGKLARQYGIPAIVFIDMSARYDRADMMVTTIEYRRLEKCGKGYENVFKRLVEENRKKSDEHLVIRASGKNEFIPIRGIEYLESNNRIITAHYNGKDIEFYGTIKDMNDRLSEKGFVRIHRSYLVSVREIVSFDSDWLELKNGKNLPIGRIYWESVKSACRKYGHAICDRTENVNVVYNI